MEESEAFAETETGLGLAADAIMANLLPFALHVTDSAAFGGLLSGRSTGYGLGVVAGRQAPPTLIQYVLEHVRLALIQTVQ